MTVTVADDKDASDQATFTVTVGLRRTPHRSRARPRTRTGPKASSLIVRPGSFTDAGDAGPWDVTVDWGDGSTPGTLEVASAGPIGTLAHTYTNDATYDMTSPVSDGELQDTQTFQIAMANVAPT